MDSNPVPQDPPTAFPGVTADPEHPCRMVSPELGKAGGQDGHWAELSRAGHHSQHVPSLLQQPQDTWVGSS